MRSVGKSLAMVLRASGDSGAVSVGCGVWRWRKHCYFWFPWTTRQDLISFDSTQVPTGEDAANGAFNIWTVKPDGSGSAPLTTLTALNADSLFPVWSADASKLAFVSSRALDGSNSVNAGSTANLWVMNADGSSAQPLTKLTAASVDFYLQSRIQWWSPDGSKLAFASTRALDGSDAAIPTGTRNIWVINADGSGAHPLTKITASGADSFLPKWSPDGSKLAFSSFRALDGSNNANTTQLISTFGSSTPMGLAQRP